MAWNSSLLYKNETESALRCAHKFCSLDSVCKSISLDIDSSDQRFSDNTGVFLANYTGASVTNKSLLIINKH